MANFNETDHGRAWRISLFEAKRRLALLGKVGVVILTMLANLVLPGHHFASECVRAIMCYDGGSQ
jgi:hypothetical protein